MMTLHPKMQNVTTTRSSACMEMRHLTKEAITWVRVDRGAASPFDSDWVMQRLWHAGAVLAVSDGGGWKCQRDAVGDGHCCWGLEMTMGSWLKLF
jgi:hypothetical protein